MDPIYRPLPRTGPVRPDGALPLAGGWAWFTEVERRTPGGPPRVVPAAEVPDEVRIRLTARRPAFAGLACDRPRVMGILNLTPDSFSDGGTLSGPHAACARALAWGADADLIDVGGESTRPGAEEVGTDAEIARVVPAIEALLAAGVRAPILVDTRKAAVAEAALAAGARVVNDVSGLRHDALMAGVVARAGASLVLMHSRGTPATMAGLARYDDPVAEVIAELSAQVAVAEAAGIPRDRIAVDPGLGFAKTPAQSLTLLANVSALHALGLPVLVGASRKGFVGLIGGVERPADRGPGSLALALAAAAEGVQLHRVHDTRETAQAFRLAAAVREGHLP